ncbi:Hint domain-containing protein [Asaia sp. HN010]|uniref:Hint domain-containing protein n=1 Tax=Asaia sp. HN010 TaxID=3081233 RepID=UPI0030181E3F
MPIPNAGTYMLIPLLFKKADLLPPRWVTLAPFNNTMVLQAYMLHYSESTKPQPRKVTFDGTKVSWTANDGQTESITYDPTSVAALTAPQTSSAFVTTTNGDLLFLARYIVWGYEAINPNNIYVVPHSPANSSWPSYSTYCEDNTYRWNQTGNYYLGQSQNINFDPFRDPCYLAGTEILTESGLQLIENIPDGAKICTFDRLGNPQSLKTMTHLVRASRNIDAHLPDDLAGYPIRVKKDAIADCVPYKDLLITAEHCILLEGRFIPARMLVNGKSISYDKSFSSYTYYHLHIDEHSIVEADGLRTESYLATTDHDIDSSVPKKTWADAAAPLDTSREFAQHWWSLVNERCGAGNRETTITTNPALVVSTDDGTTIYPLRSKNGVFVYNIPNGIKQLRVISKTSRMNDVVGPFFDDRRSLGILVSDITIYSPTHVYSIDLNLLEQINDGWLGGDEQSGYWTNGNALLPIPELGPGMDIPLIIGISTRQCGPYLSTNEISAA